MHALQAAAAAAAGGGGGGGVRVAHAVAQGGPQDARPRLCTAGAPRMAARATINNIQKLQWRLLETSMTLEIGRETICYNKEEKPSERTGMINDVKCRNSR